MGIAAKTIPIMTSRSGAASRLTVEAYLAGGRRERLAESIVARWYSLWSRRSNRGVLPEPGSPWPRRSARDIDCSARVEPRGIPGAFATASHLRTGRVTGCISCGVAGGLTRPRPGALRNVRSP